MSRHQHIRNLDIDSELQDYMHNDAYDDDGDDEMTEEDKAQMKVALSRVREVIGDIPGLKNKAIEDILWDYYYDVPKTVDHILNKYTIAISTPKIPKKAKAKSKGEQIFFFLYYIHFFIIPLNILGNADQKLYSCRTGRVFGETITGDLPYEQWQFLPEDFWDDAPWGNIPISRKAEIIVEAPVRFGGGLKGGSGAGKTSKLAALAKARKATAEKKQQQEGTSTEKDQNNAVSLLSKLS
ncbi:HBS1 N-terminus-domain-containing protein, partial [Kalaharituber pfeilii]